MKTVAVMTLIALLTVPQLAVAQPDPVKLRWTSRGLDVSSPQYSYQSRQLNSQIRDYQNRPAKEIRKGFRLVDKKVNTYLKNLFK